MLCDEQVAVVESIEEADKERISFLIVADSNTPAGYIKLQLVMEGILVESKHLRCLMSRYVKFDTKLTKTDVLERVFFLDFPLHKTTNTPAVTFKKFRDTDTEVNMDIVFSFRCKKWAIMAQEWLFRKRMYGWPSQDTIQELASLGFFVVKKGHPFSLDIDLEWRISFSLQERKLIFNLTSVQYKCFVLLKMINRDIINLSCITTYHWKMCLFYVIEENDKQVWKRELLFHCVQLCIKQMLKWVKSGICHNYFIPAENLFDGRLSDSLRLIAEQILETILDIGFECLLYVKSANICNYVRSRRSSEWVQWLLKESKMVYEQNILPHNFNIICTALCVFNDNILNIDPIDTDKFKFIYYLWYTLDQIKHMDTITEHTKEETQLALSVLVPFIKTCLASNISAMAIQSSNPQVRDFLLTGSCALFVEGDFSGYLKFLSVLYAIGLYKECEWYLDQADEDNIINTPAYCHCRHVRRDNTIARVNVRRTCTNNQLTVFACLSFLPTEIEVIPDALKYELFKYVGTSSKCLHNDDSWHYRAVVDCNIYFLFIKYLVKEKLDNAKESDDAVNKIVTSLRGPNHRHMDVAFNLLAWIHLSDRNIPAALRCLYNSWHIMQSYCLTSSISIDKMNVNKYQFNSAKIIALVVLYNTWFERKPAIINFCCHCFCRVKLQKCSTCKISKYCSKKCQRKHWKIHEEVCKLLN